MTKAEQTADIKTPVLFVAPDYVKNWPFFGWPGDGKSSSDMWWRKQICQQPRSTTRHTCCLCVRLGKINKRDKKNTKNSKPTSTTAVCCTRGRSARSTIRKRPHHHSCFCVPLFLTSCCRRVVVFVAPAPNLPNIEVEGRANASKISLVQVQSRESETREERVSR